MTVKMRDFLIEVYGDEEQVRPIEGEMITIGGRLPTQSEVDEVVKSWNGTSAKVFEQKFVLINNEDLYKPEKEG